MEEFAQKLHSLPSDQLNSKNLVEKTLEHLSFTEVAAFIIDLEFADEHFTEWIQSLPQGKNLSEEEKSLLQRAYHSAFGKELVSACKKIKISQKDLCQSLIQMAQGRDPWEIVQLIFENDYNYYEIYTSLTQGLNWKKRLTHLQKAIDKCESAKELWQEYCSSMETLDQIILCFCLDLKREPLENLTKTLGVEGGVFHQSSPPIFLKKLPDPKKWNHAVPSLLDQVSKDDLRDLLVSREYGRTRWFQSVGPNIKSCFSGILNQSLSPNDSSEEKEGRPDFYLVLYEDGFIRGKHIGIDHIFSTETQKKFIGHVYEGNLQNQTLSLKECSSFESNDQRPSLGNLEFQDFAVSSSGLEASFNWNGKKVTLLWDPGF